MGRRKRILHEITEEVKEDIIDYTRYVISLINKKVLDEYGIYENEFLEYIYIVCESIYQREGEFELTQEEVEYYLDVKKHLDSITGELKKKTAFVIGINKDNSFIFQFKDNKTFKKFHKFF